MITAKFCPQCHSELRDDAPDGLCPKCLLSQALESSHHTPDGDPGTSPYFGPFTPPAVEDLAKLFPHLEIVELLGHGGMGAVYKARQPKLDRLVALKILPPREGGDGSFAERFNREARALAKLDHSNIVRVHDFGEASSRAASAPGETRGAGATPLTGNLHYFVMEYVDGVSLRHLMRRGKIPAEQALAVVSQICDALQYAHDEGIIHRDIKPENVLLDAKNRVKLADFGLAKLSTRTPADRTLTQAHQVMGTPHYMAPEQLERPSTVDHRADIYSLGVVLYEMLTGELPLGSFTPPSQKADVDPRFDQIVQKALAKEPERRYQRISDFKNGLHRIGRSSPPCEGGDGGVSEQISFPAVIVNEGAGYNVPVLVHCDGKGIRLEYETRSWRNWWSPQFCNLRILADDITSFQIREGLFRFSVIMQCSRWEVLSALSGTAKQGRLKLRVEASNSQAALQMAEKLGFAKVAPVQQSAKKPSGGVAAVLLTIAALLLCLMGASTVFMPWFSVYLHGEDATADKWLEWSGLLIFGFEHWMSLSIFACFIGGFLLLPLTGLWRYRPFLRASVLALTAGTAGYLSATLILFFTPNVKPENYEHLGRRASTLTGILLKTQRHGPLAYDSSGAAYMNAATTWPRDLPVKTTQYSASGAPWVSFIACIGLLFLAAMECNAGLRRWRQDRESNPPTEDQPTGPILRKARSLMHAAENLLVGTVASDREAPSENEADAPRPSRTQGVPPDPGLTTMERALRERQEKREPPA